MDERKPRLVFLHWRGVAHTVCVTEEVPPAALRSPAGQEMASSPGTTPEPHASHCGGLRNAGVVAPLDVTNLRLSFILQKGYL